MSGFDGQVEVFGSRCGKRLLRRVWRPDGEVRGGVLLVHGLGDHTGRYGEVAALFTARGWLVAGVDFPGNGGSEGRRGVMGGVAEAHLVLDEACGWIESEAGGGPLGLVAHSMGGFLSLLFMARRPGRFGFAWVNGALVDPGWKKGRLMVAAALVLGRLLPWMTVNNGVRGAMCSHLEEAPDPLKHRRVSLGLGASLLRASRGLREEVGAIDGGLDLLMTHGADDPVCPARPAEELAAVAGPRKKRFVAFPGMLHETFRDVGKEALFAEVAAWLDAMGERR